MLWSLILAIVVDSAFGALDGLARRITDETAFIAGTDSNMWNDRLYVGPGYTAANNKISFAAGFSDDAVLQRSVKAAVYGFAPEPFDAGSVVTVTVTDEHQVSTQHTSVVQLQESGEGIWKVLLEPQNAGGNWTITAACTRGCADFSPVSIRRIAFGDLWYCAGQSNMQLNALHTFGRNDTIRAILKGEYDNLRMYQHAQISSRTPAWALPAATVPQCGVGSIGDEGPDTTCMQMQWNSPRGLAGTNISVKDYMHPAGSQSMMNMFGATCLYFGQFLTDLMREAGEGDVPLGLMDVAWGGTMIEQWTDNVTSASCVNTSMKDSSGTLFNGMVAPFLNMSVKGWLWYQGENNIGRGTSDPYYPESSGYACQLPAMIAKWRQEWTRVEGTTDPHAPFGVVDIHAGGGEGHSGGGAMGNFRWAQTANYGVLPNPAMPDTFMANSFDLGDPWAKSCVTQTGCCEDWVAGPDFLNIQRDPKCTSPFDYSNWNYDDTVFYMGPIHARPKKPVAERLARAAFNTAYGGKGAVSGPVVAGCAMRDGIVEISFNTSLLNGDNVIVQEYSKSKISQVTFGEASAMQVLQNASLGPQGWITDKDMDKKWAYVDIRKNSETSIIVDLSSLPAGTTIGGIRYAWEDHYGCGDLDMRFEPCPPASHPLMSERARLPAMPFMLRIDGNTCGCIAPQVCDAVIPSQLEV